MKHARTITAVFAMLSVIGLAAQGFRAYRAARGADAAAAALERAQADVAELSRLRSLRPERVFGPPPEQEFVNAVASVLSDAGLDPSVTRSLSRQDDRANRDATARIQDMRIELTPLSIHEIGQFLAAWRVGQPLWRITSISIRHAKARRDTPGVFEASLTCSAEYAAEGS
ncbi:MAG: hypothetical protein AAGA55_02700 [Planctomycetota bacterium]